MLRTVGLRSLIKTASELAATKVGTPPSDAQGLFESFHQYLASCNTATRAALDSRDSALPAIVDNADVVASLLEEFDVESSLDDVAYVVHGPDAMDNNEMAAVAKRVAKVLSKASEYGDEFATSLKLHLPIVIVAASGKLVGGTVSNVPGVLWFNPRSEWVEQDYVEFLTHELTHTHLFLEERRHGFYRDVNALMRDENLARSSLRRDRRPLDKVLHSLFVALEVVKLREHFPLLNDQSSIHPDTGEIMAGMYDTVEDLLLLDLPALLYPRAEELARIAIAEVRAISAADLLKTGV